MSNLRIYNTLSRSVESFVPRMPGRASVYVCGPTVYDIAHLGNARPPIVFDVLTRHLRSSGYEVTYVRNITDVDDKIVDRARANGESPLTLSARMACAYQADMRTLGCDDPTFQPKVSETMAEIIALVQQLLARGVAYELAMPSGAQDVYFSVRSFPEYGKLSRRNLDEQEVGARVERDESKRDPADFALWKGCVTDDAFGWESPWGKGRPGWHIECSAMSEKLLGHGFDIHGGGMDLIFPHHENEIAQSEAARPGAGCLARYWMHNGFLNVDKEKMSKSLGNFVRPCDVYKANDPEALRYNFLGVHYRGPLAFDLQRQDDGKVTFPGVDESERRIDYLYATRDRLAEIANETSVSHELPELSSYRKVILSAADKVGAALDDDLNTPAAIAELGELAKACNELFDFIRGRKKTPRLIEAGGALARDAIVVFDSAARVLGLLQTPVGDYRVRTRERRLAFRGLSEAEVHEKVRAREEARAARNFTRADELRGELSTWGIEIADGGVGTTWGVRV